MILFANILAVLVFAVASSGSLATVAVYAIYVTKYPEASAMIDAIRVASGQPRVHEVAAAQVARRCALAAVAALWLAVAWYTRNLW